jgi:hypothetical protein
VDRRTALTLFLGLLAVLAVATAAATLDSAVSNDRGGAVGAGGDSDGFGVGEDADEGGSAGSQFGGRITLPTLCYPILNDPRVIGGALLAFLGVGYLLRRSTGSWLPAFALGLSLSVPTYVVYAILTSCRTASADSGLLPFGGNGTSFLPEGAGGGASAVGGEGASTPSAVLAILLVVALAGAVVMLFASTGSSGGASGSGGSSSSPPPPWRP